MRTSQWKFAIIDKIADSAGIEALEWPSPTYITLFMSHPSSVDSYLTSRYHSIIISPAPAPSDTTWCWDPSWQPTLKNQINQLKLLKLAHPSSPRHLATNLFVRRGLFATCKKNKSKKPPYLLHAHHHYTVSSEFCSFTRNGSFEKKGAGFSPAGIDISLIRPRKAYAFWPSSVFSENYPGK